LHRSESASLESNAILQLPKQKDVGVAVEVVDENGSSEIAEPVMDEEPAVAADDSAKYIDYSSAKYAELKGSKPFVLFFHADWCPTCRRMEKDILEDLANYPAGTTFLKTDYDQETDLKKDYSIRVQSTVVVVDANGEVVYQATDPALDDLKAAIERSVKL